MTKKLSRQKSRWLKIQPVIVKGKDEIWGGGQEDDIVVVVMGQPGVGKSTFVKCLLSGVVVEDSAEPPTIGDDLESCTVNLQPFPIPIEGQKSRLVVVDTPAFDSTYSSDPEILRLISVWLASSYSQNMKLGGIIYLHDISSPMQPVTSRKQFEIFHALCGNSVAKAVILATTKGEGLPKDVIEKREAQLKGERVWAEMLGRGARMARFQNTSESAWKMVNMVLGCNVDGQVLRISNTVDDKLLLQIQKELVELEKIIPDTEAGRKLYYTVKEVRQMQKDSAKALKGSRNISAELREKLEFIETQISQMKIASSFWNRFKPQEPGNGRR